MFVLAHLSDPHLGPIPTPRLRELVGKRGLGFINWHRGRHAIHRPDVLDLLERDLAAMPVDHIAVTGDLVNLSLAAEFAAAHQWLARLGPPERVTVVPGNHDAYVRAAAAHPLRYWGDYMRGDAGGPITAPGAQGHFPFVRRRDPAARRRPADAPRRRARRARPRKFVPGRADPPSAAPAPCRAFQAPHRRRAVAPRHRPPWRRTGAARPCPCP